MKKTFYILLLMGFSLMGYSQPKPSPVKDVIRVVKLYPNPATNYINFEFDKKANQLYNLEIFSFIGKKVDEIKVTDQKVMISLAEYYRGIYIYQLRDLQGGIVGTGKFQVTK